MSCLSCCYNNDNILSLVLASRQCGSIGGSCLVGWFFSSVLQPWKIRGLGSLYPPPCFTDQNSSKLFVWNNMGVVRNKRWNSRADCYSAPAGSRIQHRARKWTQPWASMILWPLLSLKLHNPHPKTCSSNHVTCTMVWSHDLLVTAMSEIMEQEHLASPRPGSPNLHFWV